MVINNYHRANVIGLNPIACKKKKEIIAVDKMRLLVHIYAYSVHL